MGCKPLKSNGFAEFPAKHFDASGVRKKSLRSNIQQAHYTLRC